MCLKLWERYNITEEAFAVLNPGVVCENLQLGQVLCMGSGIGPCGGLYVVQVGNSCWQLWTDNGLTEQQFRDLNPGLDCTALQPGQSVCVASNDG